VDNEYSTKHRRLLDIKPETIPDNNLVSSVLAFVSGKSSYDPDDSPCDDEEYLILNNVAETTPG
jgi:hypothetical protein